MKIQIESTSQITRIGDVPVRLWEGVTVSGIPCKVFVHRVAVANEHDSEDFVNELQEQMPPASDRHFNLRNIL